MPLLHQVFLSTILEPKTVSAIVPSPLAGKPVKRPASGGG
jgi:hypothetical protein